MRDIYVDAHDVHWTQPEIEVQTGALRWHFVFDGAIKAGRQFSYALYFNETALTPGVYRYPLNRRIAALRETPLRAIYQRHAEIAARFGRVYTFDADLIRQGPPFIAHMNGVNWLGGWGQSGEIAEKTGNVSFIGSIEHSDQGGYSLRKRVAAYLLSQPGVDCYGKGIRPIPSKLSALAPYRYSVAMENVRCDYYFTEKLVDCVLAEAIPVYWGCPSIDRVLDPRGVLSFETLDDLKALLPTLTEARYDQMRKFALSNKRHLLSSELATTEGYLARLARAIGTEPLAPMGVLKRGRLWAALRMLGGA